MDDSQVAAVLFTVNVDALAAFYERIAEMRRAHAEDDFVILMKDSFQLTVHRIPEQLAAGISGSSPPAVRESVAVKLAYRVSDIAASRQIAPDLGGLVYGPEREWGDDSDRYCDGYDPDGNVFQLFQLG